jgi:hypothetical protein
VNVADPSGRRWLVGRRILPWRRRWEAPDVDGFDGFDVDDLVA